MVSRLDLMYEGKLDARGNEIPDPNPVSIPAGFKKPESLSEQIKRLIRTSLSDEAAARGMETFEESEDFDVDDESFDPSSPYEEVFDPVLGRGITLEEFKANEAVYRRRYLEAEQRAYEAMDRSAALRAKPRVDVERLEEQLEPAPPPVGKSGRVAPASRSRREDEE